jgi:LuxR family transcriptional regulator, maltose regulon positive regulatory protein
VTARKGPTQEDMLEKGTARRGAPGSATVSVRFRPPPAHVDVVPRRALLGRLADSTEPLVLFCAPAGAGKTAVLRQWAEADERPVVWVRLDPADDDYVVLLFKLAEALDTVLPLDPDVRAALMRNVPPVRERVLPLLGEALATGDPFVLVLDDAHLMASTAAWDVVDFVLHSLPAGAQLAVGTRTDPPLSLARLRAAGELAEFRFADLAFDEEEAAELVRQRACCAPTPEVVEGLLGITEGWAVGLHLACVASCAEPVEHWLPQLAGGRRDIAAYLSSEVFDRQPPEMREFLLRTAVLRQLTPASCLAVTGREDAGELLELAAHEELFLVSLGNGGMRYRYHSLFAEVLLEELERLRPGEARLLHRKAGAWYAAHEDPDGAVYHLLAGSDVSGAADVVASSWPALWDRGQADTVRRWLLSFTDRQILAHKALTLTAGWVFTALDGGELGARWGRAACEAVVGDERSPDGASSLRSSQALLRATVAPDGVGRMREDAELAAELEATTGTSWHADAQVALGVARWLSGSTQRALHPLALGAREGAMCNTSAELAALGYLSLVSVEQEEWETAEEYEARAAARLAELGFGTSRRCLPMLLARVALLARDPHADVAGATADVHRLLEHMVPHPWMALLTHVVLGEVALVRADKLEAEAHSAAASALLRRYPDAGILRHQAEHLRQGVEVRRVAEPLTAAEQKILDMLPTHYTEVQIAQQLYISHNTVKTHVKSVYRKLGASSRAESVQRAREVGLLPPV